MSLIFMEPPNMGDLLVVEDLPVPGVTSVHQVLPLKVNIDENDSIAIMDKKKAHGLFEIMLIQTGKIIKAGIDDLSNDEYQLFTQLMRVFGKFILDETLKDELNLKGYLPRISFNYDPLTRDRDGLQDIKRFHAHMFLVSPEQQDYIEENKRKISQIEGSYQKRRLADPWSFITEQLLHELHLARRVSLPKGISLVYMSPEEKILKGHPLGLNLQIINGWNYIGEEAFSKYLLNLQAAIKIATDEIYIAFTGDRVKDVLFERNSLLDPETIRYNLTQITWLSESSRQVLIQISEILKPFPEKLMKSTHFHPQLINHHVIANGPAFTVSISSELNVGEQEESNSIFMNISVRLFSDIGGAGLFGCQNVSGIFLDRMKGEFTEAQMTLRHLFQRKFLQVVKESTCYPTETLTAEEVNTLLAQTN